MDKVDPHKEKTSDATLRAALKPPKEKVEHLGFGSTAIKENKAMLEARQASRVPTVCECSQNEPGSSSEPHFNQPLTWLTPHARRHCRLRLL
jgi:hypothetical protein